MEDGADVAWHSRWDVRQIVQQTNCHRSAEALTRPIVRRGSLSSSITETVAARSGGDHCGRIIRHHRRQFHPLRSSLLDELASFIVAWLRLRPLWSLLIVVSRRGRPVGRYDDDVDHLCIEWHCSQKRVETSLCSLWALIPCELWRERERGERLNTLLFLT